MKIANPATKIRREPLVDPSRGFRRDAVPLLVVEESEPGRLAEEAVNGERRGDEGPAAISVGRVAAEEEKGPRSDERQKLVMLAAKGGTDRISEIPGGVPIRELRPDPALAAHRDLDALVEGCQIQDLLGPQRVSHGSEPLAVDAGLRGE